MLFSTEQPSTIAFWQRRGVAITALFLAYCAVAMAGLHFASVHRNVSPVWPASAVALAGLLLFGASYWPVIFAAGTLVSLWTGAPWWAAAIAGSGVTLQAVLGAVALRHVRFSPTMNSVADLLKLWAVAGVVAAAVSPSMGVLGLTAAGFIPLEGATAAWVTWYLGDAAGIVLVTPLLLTLLARPWRRPPLRRVAEGAAVLVAVAVAAEIAFDPANGYPFLPFVVLFYVAVRFDLRITAVAVVIVSSVAVWETAHGRSQFIASSPHESLLQLHRFVLVLGSVSLVLAALFDEQRHIVAALQSSEARFRLVFEGSPLPKVIYDRASATLLDVNDAWEQTFGWKRAELTGNADALSLWVDPADREEFGNTLRQGSIASRETRLHTREGLERYGLLSASVIQFQGNEQVVATFQDLTEHRKLEEQLRQAQKMEAVGHVTSGVAHDFNNVLSAVLANAQLGKAESTGNEHLGRTLDEITAAARRGTAMVRQLLSLSRRAHLKFVPTDLNESVRDAARMLRRLVPEDIEIRLAIEDPPKVALVDDTSVSQVLLNLATNARDAMPDGGVLSIGVGEARLSEFDCEASPRAVPGDYIMVTVTDTGTGMDEKTQLGAFEPFFTTKSAQRGTGLGMAMVQSLLRQHGGLVQLTSDVGQGTTVRLYFPAADIPTTPLESDQSKSAFKGGNETILLVEDDNAVADVALRALRRYGYTVLLARNGREGLDMFKANAAQVDLVISDAIMPRMSGAELYTAINEESDPPRFLLSSGYPQGSLAKHFDDKASPFLPKPWDVDDLVKAVRDALDAPIGDQTS